MGAGSSSTVNIDIDVLNESLTKTFNANNNKAGVAVETFQNLDVNGLKAVSCTLEIVQDSKMDITVLQKIDSDVQQNVIQDIMTSLESQVKNSASAESGFAAFPAVSVATTNIKQHIHNILSSQLSVDNINESIVKINAIQKMGLSNVVMDPCGYSLYPAGPSDAALKTCGSKERVCKVTQGIQVSLLVENIIANVIKTLSEDKDVSSFINKIDSSSDAVAHGFLDGLSQLFGQFKWIILGVVLLIVLGGIAMMVLKPKETAAAMNKVVNKTAQSINKVVNTTATAVKNA